MDDHNRLRTMTCDRLDQPISLVPKVQVVPVVPLKRKRRHENEALLRPRCGRVDVAVRSVIENPIDLSARLASAAGDGLQRIDLRWRKKADVRDRIERKRKAKEESTDDIGSPGRTGSSSGGDCPGPEVGARLVLAEVIRPARLQAVQTRSGVGPEDGKSARRLLDREGPLDVLEQSDET